MARMIMNMPGLVVDAGMMQSMGEIVTKLYRSDQSKTYERNATENIALAQIGWLGISGTVYPLGNGHPTSVDEPAGFSPLLIQVGTWEDLGDGFWSICD